MFSSKKTRYVDNDIFKPEAFQCDIPWVLPKWMEVNRMSFIKMNRLFKRCYKVLATPRSPSSLVFFDWPEVDLFSMMSTFTTFLLARGWYNDKWSNLILFCLGGAIWHMFYLYPYPGRWSHLTSIFFEWVEQLKPPTSYIIISVFSFFVLSIHLGS